MKNQPLIFAYDERRDLAVPGHKEDLFQYGVEHFIVTANQAIADHGFFTVALSGGSTPKGIFSLLASPEYRSKLDWSKVLLFWSDERSVSPDDPESNYRMAMDAGFSKLGILKENIFRMVAETDIQENAKRYEQIIREKVPGASFDLVMLGMGDDGHTASLFPHTEGLHVQNKLVTANYVPSKQTWRLTLTFDSINAAKVIAIYVTGKEKQQKLKEVFTHDYEPDELPIQKIGTIEHRALWIFDLETAEALLITLGNILNGKE